MNEEQDIYDAVAEYRRKFPEPKRKPNPIKGVTPHEDGTFLVQSRTRDMQHRIEVSPFTCSCEARQANEKTKANVCPHMQSVVEWLGWETIRRMTQ